MDWKRFYADELASDAGRRLVEDAVARHAGGDAAVLRTFAARGVVSFPHLQLRDSADPIARVATSIVASGAKRVVALGVLHGGTLPEPFRALLAEVPRSDEAFARLGGAFTVDGPNLGPSVRRDAALLANEFSLDLFDAVLLAAGARVEVVRLFVGPTRDPRGGFDVAKEIADAVRPLLDAETVCVATGDLVHFGNAYSDGELRMCVGAAFEDVVRDRVDAMHEAALARRDFAAAYETGTKLRSDQRNILPVIAELLGPGASAETLSFAMSDYAAINGVPPPSLVAAALVAFRPA